MLSSKVSTSTPKGIITKFERKIDSFSLDNSSPTWSSPSDQDNNSTINEERSQGGKQPGEGQQQDVHLQVEGQQRGIQGLTREEVNLLEALELRSGKRVTRKRISSLREEIVEGRQNFITINHRISQSSNIVKAGDTSVKKMSASEMNFVSQLVINNIPLLEAEVGPNLANEVDIFIKCCEHVNECLGKEEEKRFFLQLIPTKFRGRAAIILDGIEYKTLRDLTNLLLTKLVNTKPYQAQLNELRTCRQIPGEPLFLFGRRVTQLLRGCKAAARKRHVSGTEAIDADLEETAIFTFKAGILNPHHRLYLATINETSLEKIIKRAEQLEEHEIQMLTMQQNTAINFVNHNPTLNNILPYHYSNSHMNTHNPMGIYGNQTTNSLMYNNSLPASFGNTNSFQVSTPLQTVGGLPNIVSNNPLQGSAELTMNNSKPNIPAKKCGFCNRTNHTYAECRIRKATPYCPKCKVYGHNTSNCQKSKPSYHTNTSSHQCSAIETAPPRKKCNFCQRNGHIITECRAKQLWEANMARSSENDKFQEN